MLDNSWGLVMTLDMLSLEEALSQLLSSVTSTEVVSCPLLKACGRFAAEPLSAGIDLPGFDNSAMDGYAVRAADVATASDSSPVRLRLIDRVSAGAASERPLAAGECIRLFTGSILPSGADAVVMQEDVTVLSAEPGIIAVRDPVKPWENVRFRGEDVKRGSMVLSPGDQLKPQSLGLLAAMGNATVSIHRPPKVAVLASGNELYEPGAPLPPGGIYESNRLCLAAAAQECGAEVELFPLVPDSLESTVTALREAFSRAEVVITTGGVSVGELDFLKPAFAALGGTTEFWRVAIKPGKPFVHGHWKGRRWFGLPGNPVSAWVTFLLLVRPVLLAMQGAARTHLPVAWGKLREPLKNPGDRRHFIRVILDDSGEVRSAGRQGSHCQGSLAQANGLVDVAPNGSLTIGTPVKVLCFPVLP
jgi:molybdopterin molybdotransferase